MAKRVELIQTLGRERKREREEKTERKMVLFCLVLRYVIVKRTKEGKKEGKKINIVLCKKRKTASCYCIHGKIPISFQWVNNGTNSDPKIGLVLLPLSLPLALCSDKNHVAALPGLGMPAMTQ